MNLELSINRTPVAEANEGENFTGWNGGQEGIALQVHPCWPHAFGVEFNSD